VILVIITIYSYNSYYCLEYYDSEEGAHQQMVGASNTTIPTSESMTSYYSVVPPSASKTMMMNHPNPTTTTTTTTMAPQPQNHPSDVQEAEKYKNLGNTYMQQKLYTKAIECYTTALQYAPLSYNAHVHYSNRAAAYISSKDYTNAILDSERALMIAPTYGKGHARLGLAYFLSGQYRNAVEAYTVALKYDPDNQSSKNYFEKSALRWAEQEQQQVGSSGPGEDGPMNQSHDTTHASVVSSPSQNNSFSVISELERSSGMNNTMNHHHQQHHLLPPNKSSGMPSHHQHHSAPPPPSPTITTAPSSSSVLHDSNNRSTSSNGNNNSVEVSSGGNGTILKEAERYKIKGNTYMSQKDYNNAIQSYTKAIQLLPKDVQKSHVYYSNRAAAFCYLECYHDAEMDAMRAIQLVPTYGKAYARLGLSRFLLKNYAGAVSAYQTALQYDPNNSASQSYLIKAQQKLVVQQQQQQNGTITNASVSSSGTSSRTGLV
jgi:tetratricopeptide (TPR) repeat protein